MKIRSITLGSYRRAKQCIAEIESQKEAKRYLKNELEKNNMIDRDAKETIKREIIFLEDNIARFRTELRRIEKNAFGLDWVGTFPEDDVIDAKRLMKIIEICSGGKDSTVNLVINTKGKPVAVEGLGDNGSMMAVIAQRISVRGE